MKNINSIFRDGLNLVFIMFMLSTFSCKDEDLGAFTPSEPDLSLSSGDVNIPKEGDTLIINVSSNLPWRAKSDASWVSLDSASGLGSGSFVANVSKNNTTEQRQAQITAWITDDYQKNFTIVQAPGDAPQVIEQHFYVKVAGSGDGSSWASSTTLDNALSQIEDEGAIIHIAAGTYTPTVAITGGDPTSNADLTFEIKNNTTLIGGYPADASEGAVANSVVNTSVLSGDLGGGQNSKHVVTITAPLIDEQKVSLQGLTIKDGNASVSGTISINSVSYPNNYAGGLIVAKSIVELKGCTISDNKASSHGVGIYAFSGAELTMDQCLVQANVGATSNGAGMYLNGASSTINNSVFQNNETDGVAGAIQAYSSKLYMYNSTIANNKSGVQGTAGRRAGGLYVRNSSNCLLVNCTLYGNTATGNGGAITTYSSSTVDVVSSTITANSGAGGGINTPSGNTVTFYNSIVSGNTLADGSGASDVIGAVAHKSGIEGTKIYDVDGVEQPGLAFDFSTMLGTLASNGGDTQTCTLIGSNNPAKTEGLSITALEVLGATFIPVIPTDIIINDQTGTSRANKTYMGASVK
ncbi:MAG: right-handed parallel beta-helix repeat-containing protein [Bacteroidales bacterium]